MIKVKHVIYRNVDRNNGGFPSGFYGKKKKKIYLPMQETLETWVWSLGQEDTLEEEMATHSSILAWRIPRTEEPAGLQSMGSQSQTQLSEHMGTDRNNRLSRLIDRQTDAFWNSDRCQAILADAETKTA